MTNTILADDESTWPPDLIQLLAARLSGISAYHTHRQRIDRAMQDDVMLRINPPPNPHQGVWNKTAREAQAIIADHDIVGYHCTRLTDAERCDIAAGGLTRLSPDLVTAKVKALENSGTLTEGQAKALLVEHQGAKAGRSGAIWFVFDRQLLRDQCGVEKLFRNWGGEAIYWRREEEPAGDALRRIGSPAIVVARIPATAIETHLDASDRLVNRYLGTRGVAVPHALPWEGRVCADIPGENIERIITIALPEFIGLTGCDMWRPALS